MLELGREAGRVLKGTIEAFANRDAKAARYIWEEDDVVDVRYHLVRHDLMTMLEGLELFLLFNMMPVFCNVRRIFSG